MEQDRWKIVSILLRRSDNCNSAFFGTCAGLSGLSAYYYRFFAVCLVCIGLVNGIGCAKLFKDRNEPKNLIFISIDTLRADHLSCYGYAQSTSPRIDAFAKTGVVFRNATSPSSWTIPSHLTMFTGLSPATHGYIDYEIFRRLNSNAETMANVFARNGYKTGAFTGGGFVGTRHGIDIGFQTFETHGTRFENNLKAAGEWLDGVGQQPFFLFLHGFNVHWPYGPPVQYRNRFIEGYEGDYSLEKFKPDLPQPSDADVKLVVSQYDSEIAYVDDLLGDFLDQLKSRGILQDTLVVITSDHGEEFYEHGGRDHIQTLYRELLHVPWIMFGPSIPAAVKWDHVGTIDLLPTILELFSLKTEATLQGKSRATMIAQEKEPLDDEVMSYTGFSSYPYHLSSIKTKRWKLIHNQLTGMEDVKPGDERKQKFTFLVKKRTGEYLELFDLDADPMEQNNIADQQPDVAEKLFGKLKQYTTLYTKDRLEMEKVKKPMTKEQGEVLRSLGYAR